MSGFEAFKRQKELLAKSQAESQDSNEASKPEIETANDAVLLGHVEDLKGQEDSALQAKTHPLGSTAIKYQTLDEAYVGFYQTQGPRVLTCLKSLKYRLDEGHLVIETESTTGWLTRTGYLARSSEIHSFSSADW